jgi:hypothetical protein
MTFEPGVSGNPAGRKPGVKSNKLTPEEIAMAAAKDARKVIKWARAAMKDPSLSFEQHCDAAQILTEFAAKTLPPKAPKPAPAPAAPPPLPTSDEAPVASASAEVEPPPQPKPQQLQPIELAALSQPRIMGEDSHTCIVGSDGKVVYKPRTQAPKPPSYAQVCEAANASDPRRYRR